MGPTIWKIAMTGIKPATDSMVKIITYADDIALLVGATRPPKAIEKLETSLEDLKSWAHEYELSFSTQKSQFMTIKGGLKPGYTAKFGTLPDAEVITATETVRYLGIQLDPRRSYWHHIDNLADKSKDLYMRLRRMTSANWGMPA